MELIRKSDALHAVLHNTGDAAVAAVQEIKAEDVVPVVRCRECKRGITGNGITDGWVLCSKPYTEKGNAMHRADWFCANGKRKDGESDV